MADKSSHIPPERPQPPKTLELFPMEPGVEEERVWVHGHWRTQKGKAVYVDGHWRVKAR